MEGIFCPWEPAKYLIFSANVPQVLYYALIPGMAVAILLSLFVFLNNRKSFSSILLLFISLCFFVWGIFALILFATNSPSLVMLFWSYTILVEPFIYAGGLYLAYVFFDKRDMSFVKKIIMIFLLSPFVILLPTRFNLVGVKIIDCTAIEGPVALYFSYAVEIIFVLWLIVLAVNRYKNAKDKTFKKEIVLFTFGIIFFLLTFSSGNIIGSFTSDWVTSQYGYFGMPVFIGLLAYSIVKYKTFNIKLLGAQALVFGIIILIASQFFFIQNQTNRFLTAITLIIVATFGWWLVKSVKKEIQQKEALEIANAKISSQNEQLEVANVELKKADQAKNEFINIASHQLRTPITVIKGTISMLQDGTMDSFDEEKRKKFYDGARFKCQKLEDIINDILNATSLTNKKFSVMDSEAEKINVKEFFDKMVEDFKPETMEREIDLSVGELDKAVPDIFGQRKYLEEAFSNLISNAIKYTPSPKQTPDIRDKRDGKATITISNHREGNDVIFSVKDNGIGIPEEAMPKLFQKFVRAKNAVDIYTDGTGLGLFIIKEIVEGHGGKVWVESELGKGSEFFVKLPIRSADTVNVKEYIKERADLKM